MSEAEAESVFALARRARAATGLSQAGFGRLLGVSTATISAWEQERRTPLPKRMVRALLGLIASRPGWCIEELHKAAGGKKCRQHGEGGVELRILRACRQLAQGPAQRVSLDRLRGVLREDPRWLVDEGLERLERDGRIALSAAVFVGQLSESERAAVLRRESGEEVLFADLLI